MTATRRVGERAKGRVGVDKAWRGAALGRT